MSYWTHVNCIMRVDEVYGYTPDGAILRDLFKTCTYDSSEKEFAECNVPCGSEGSLQVSIWISPSEYGVDRYTVSIFGDLRDYEETRHQEIVEWLNHMIQDKELMIRDGVMTVNEKAYRYEWITNEFVLIKEEETK